MPQLSRLVVRLLVPTISVPVVLALASVVDAQTASTTSVVLESVECEECTIRLDRVAVLGTSDGPGVLEGTPHSVSRDSRGRYYVTTDPGSTPFVFRPNGRFLQRLGRDGRGPGEYREALIIEVSAADTLHVFDGAGRYTVLSPEYEVVRTAIIPAGAWDATQVASGEIVVNAHARDADLIGYLLHRFDAVGNYLGAFEMLERVIPTQPHLFARWLAGSQNGGVWSAPYEGEYVLNLWDRNRQLATRVVRRVDWFEPYDEYWLPTERRAPAPQIMDLREASGGLLWVVVWVGGEQWRKGLGKPFRAEGQLAYPLEDWQLIYDSRIEVIDSKRERVVISGKFPQALFTIVDDSHVAGFRQEDDGSFRIDVWRARLVR